MPRYERSQIKKGLFIRGGIHQAGDADYDDDEADFTPPRQLKQRPTPDVSLTAIANRMAEVTKKLNEISAQVRAARSK